MTLTSSVTVAHLLNRTFAVSRPSLTGDGYGGDTVAFTAVGTVAARVSRPSAAERQVASQEGAEISHEVYLTPGADVRRGDRLTGDGQVLEVIAVIEPSKAAYLKAECREDVAAPTA